MKMKCEKYSIGRHNVDLKATTEEKLLERGL